ncbi:hypothetical protein Ahy_A03g010971 isoform G [Arachis hypogaea]|uniref:Uncharacterized protein n=1 Tax=Arachis hypogaea TaxID=3818 RepID=A0A445DP43_ARAHY|nr:hypothetical protein Ahy_A03g010971 isoform G [Arachis hypogaea]
MNGEKRERKEVEGDWVRGEGNGREKSEEDRGRKERNEGEEESEGPRLSPSNPPTASPLFVLITARDVARELAQVERAVFPHHRCHRRALSSSRKTPPLPLIEAAARKAKPLWSLKPKGVVTTAVPRARCCCCWVRRREESEQGKEEGGDRDLRCCCCYYRCSGARGYCRCW